jgi:hypothetical protein
MKLNRRDFVGLAGASLALTALPGAPSAASEAHGVLEMNGWRLAVSPTGDILSLRSGGTELVNPKLADTHPHIVIPWKKVFDCNNPVSFRREGQKLIYQYAFSDRYRFKVDYEIELLPLEGGSVALKQKIGLEASTPVDGDIKLVLPRNILLPYERRKVFLPLKNGVGRRRTVGALDNEDEYAYQFAGSYEGGKAQLLAVPMVDEFSDQGDLRLTFCSDPYFTSYFALPFGEKPGHFHCIYPESLGLRGREERTVSTAIHRGDPRSAMKAFYACALPDVAEGPDWLHDIAMNTYDYLSENGAGWFRDIDKLTEVVAPADRHKVFLALHGWYDLIGRYTYDPKTRSLGKKWTAFPSAKSPMVAALGTAPREWTLNYWPSASIAALQPVEMSLEDMHRRIRYARDRGFRVGLYFADGTSSCTAVTENPDPATVLSWGGWVGPDTGGKTFQQNPLHPEVRDFFEGYAQALMDEYGKELDGLILDETYFIDPGNPGTEACPGYADRAMMTLVKELSAVVAKAQPQAAFFASDVIGVRHWDYKAPYALAAHATYQDSNCRPEAWSYGLFPNFRNTLWSCNWMPVTNFHWTKYGVETFDTPVVVTNGSAGDDIGISELSPDMLKQVMDLFEARKKRRMEISWIEENDGVPTYLGRPIRYKQSLW